LNKVLLEQLVENKQALLAFVQKRVQDSALADDILQDLYLKLSSLDPDMTVQYPKAYVFRIANNLVIDHQRKLSKQTRLEDEHLNNEQYTITPERQLSSKQQLDAVTEAINELPSKTREVIRLQKLKDQPKAVIASQLDISVNMVEKHLRRALQHCRERLKKSE